MEIIWKKYTFRSFVQKENCFNKLQIGTMVIKDHFIYVYLGDSLYYKICNIEDILEIEDYIEELLKGTFDKHKIDIFGSFVNTIKISTYRVEELRKWVLKNKLLGYITEGFKK